MELVFTKVEHKVHSRIFYGALKLYVAIPQVPKLRPEVVPTRPGKRACTTFLKVKIFSDCHNCYQAGLPDMCCVKQILHQESQAWNIHQIGSIALWKYGFHELVICTETSPKVGYLGIWVMYQNEPPFTTQIFWGGQTSLNSTKGLKYSMKHKRYKRRAQCMSGAATAQLTLNDFQGIRRTDHWRVRIS